jgi:hypothetical protein
MAATVARARSEYDAFAPYYDAFTAASDHEEIRRWVEEHGGTPRSLAGAGEGSDDAGVLRIDFPGGAGEDQVEHISWDGWFETFDKSGLAFLYQEQKASGEDSTFFKLVRRDSD